MKSCLSANLSTHLRIHRLLLAELVPFWMPNIYDVLGRSRHHLPQRCPWRKKAVTKLLWSIMKSPLLKMKFHNRTLLPNIKKAVWMSLHICNLKKFYTDFHISDGWRKSCFRCHKLEHCKIRLTVYKKSSLGQTWNLIGGKTQIDWEFNRPKYKSKMKKWEFYRKIRSLLNSVAISKFQFHLGKLTTH